MTTTIELTDDELEWLQMEVHSSLKLTDSHLKAARKTGPWKAINCTRKEALASCRRDRDLLLELQRKVGRWTYPVKETAA